MHVKFIEAENGPPEQPFNFGKFALLRFTEEEWAYESVIEPQRSLLGARGWTRDHLLVLDLQTGEGAMFRPGGSARSDVGKHRVWVCPLFEPLLTWLYRRDVSDLDALPAKVSLTFEEAPPAMAGYRRKGSLAARRRLAGVSQEDIASMLGVHQTIISNIETGKKIGEKHLRVREQMDELLPELPERPAQTIQEFEENRQRCRELLKEKFNNAPDGPEGDLTRVAAMGLLEQVS